jgi:hypothetical protein
MKTSKFRLQLETEFNSTLDNASLKLFSRHNAGGDTANRYGGMGLAFKHDSIDVKEETYHNVHKSIATKKLPKAIPNDKPVVLRYDCALEMPAKKFTVEGFIDYDLNGNFVSVGKVSYTSSAPGVSDDKEVLYCWVRTNGAAKDIVFRNEKYIQLA